MRRKVRCLLLCVFACFSMMAQNLSVESFKLLENDLTANTQGTMMRDQNGEVAALIRIVTTEKGFVFDGGMMGIVATKQDVGEILLYVPYGIQKITIKHEQLGVLRDYYFPIPIEKARTYELKLTTGTVRTIVEQAQTSQFVVFKVEPTSAVIFIDEEDAPHPLDSEGMYSVRLNKGHHTYRVTAASYISESGAIEVESEKITKQINLNSALATLTVNTAPDAEVWINEIKKGTGNWSGSVEAGIYLVEARKVSHSTVRQEVTLSQQEQRSVTLSAPEPIYGSLEVTGTPNEADIYIDGILMGQTPLFVDKVLIGNHTLEIQKDGYITEKKEVYILEGETYDQQISLKNGEFHEYVDLGLSVKWATCNVGASKPEEYGDYYAWGETETYYEAGYAKEDPQSHWKDDKPAGYVWSTYKWCSGSSTTLTKYNTDSNYGIVDNKTTLDLDDDVAHVKWGGSWRMPTKAEQYELRSNCTWTWTVLNGVEGYRVTSKKSGYTNRYIFLPAAGYRSGAGLSGIGSVGYYWSGSLGTEYPKFAWYFDFRSSYVDTYDNSRDLGRSVRPVCP